ncbi:MAG: HesA/MoeB/ThiF family protein, partial [Candidatus Omnitrophota bacterium]
PVHEGDHQVGAGGLGSAAAIYLAAAGAGTLGIVDPEKVALENLQRQILHTQKSLGRLKVASARQAIRRLNPQVKVKTLATRLTRHNILEIINDYDIICDCTDNFLSRYLLNDACVMTKKPLVHASILGFEGQAITIIPGKSACYRCLYSEANPAEATSCAAAGVMATVAGIMGILQANEVLKLILKIGKPLTDRLLWFNGLDSAMKLVEVRRRKDCPVCSKSAARKNLEEE